MSAPLHGQGTALLQVRNLRKTYGERVVVVVPALTPRDS